MLVERGTSPSFRARFPNSHSDSHFSPRSPLHFLTEHIPSRAHPRLSCLFPARIAGRNHLGYNGGTLAASLTRISMLARLVRLLTASATRRPRVFLTFGSRLVSDRHLSVETPSPHPLAASAPSASLAHSSRPNLPRRLARKSGPSCLWPAGPLWGPAGQRQLPLHPRTSPTAGFTPAASASAPSRRRCRLACCAGEWGGRRCPRPAFGPACGRRAG